MRNRARRADHSAVGTREPSRTSAGGSPRRAAQRQRRPLPVPRGTTPRGRQNGAQGGRRGASHPQPRHKSKRRAGTRSPTLALSRSSLAERMNPRGRVLKGVRQWTNATSKKAQRLPSARACRKRGENAALLRREGLCSSHLVVWRPGQGARRVRKPLSAERSAQDDRASRTRRRPSSRRRSRQVR